MSVNKVITISGDLSCEIVIGRALLEEVCNSVSKNATKVLVVHPVGLSPSAELLREALISVGYEAILAGVPDSEDAKRVEVAAFCWGIMGQSDFTRSDAVIGFGGGSTTDLAGFVAATWLRGIQLVQVPTTLLGMVDASIGGKTGINTAEGKNLVGSFYSPTRVIVDLDTLGSLPRNEILAGFAEVVKYGFISDPRILDLIEQNVDVATDPKTDVFREIIERCIAIKAKVVGGDFKESGLREILNYGHTLGHAIEHAERYKWRHGAAISIGMVFVAELARIAGRLGDEVVDRHRSVLGLLGLPISYPASKWNQLVETMQRDKKSRAGTLRFVVLDDLAKPTIMTAPTPEILYAAFQEIVDS
jgi:3-dehydroquinate synthase